jgi:hypothetical protein
VAGAYSVRFAMVTNSDDTYTVPPAKRAVIKCLSGYNGAAVANGISVYIGSIPVMAQLIPAGSGREYTSLHIVANSGETIRLSATGPGGWQLSGYLLDA